MVAGGQASSRDGVGGIECVGCCVDGVSDRSGGTVGAFKGGC